MFRRRSVSILLLALSVDLVAAAALAGECAGVRLPDAVAVDGKTLALNGMGLREATVFKVDVYIAALYVEHRSADAALLVNGEQIKQLRIHFVRDVSRENMLENMERAVRAGAGAKFAALEARFNQLKSWMPAMRAGEEFIVTYRPGVGIDVLHGTRSLGPVAGKDYADAVLRIWLGDYPPTPELKRGLLGGPCG